MSRREKSNRFVMQMIINWSATCTDKRNKKYRSVKDISSYYYSSSGKTVTGNIETGSTETGTKT